VLTGEAHGRACRFAGRRTQPRARPTRPRSAAYPYDMVPSSLPTEHGARTPTSHAHTCGLGRHTAHVIKLETEMNITREGLPHARPALAARCAWRYAGGAPRVFDT